jgi:hypothetical protein
MEVRIGVQNSSREVSIDVPMSADEVSSAFSSALASSQVLSLTDGRGRTVMVPATAIAYIDVAGSEIRKVGFGA